MAQLDCEPLSAVITDMYLHTSSHTLHSTYFFSLMPSSNVYVCSVSYVWAEHSSTIRDSLKLIWPVYSSALAWTAVGCSYCRVWH